jgi:DnaK suppressor protein
MAPMKKADVQKYKKKLEELRQHLSRSLQGTTAEVKTPDEATGYSQHQADQGTDDFDRTISLEITSAEYAILRQIDRALEKVNEGTYGVCDLSGKPIPPARLDAVPYATMTVEAQEQLEKGLI